MVEELAEKARSGDKAAERELFRNLFVSFRLIVKQRLSTASAEQWEDIAQDACKTVLEKYQDEVFVKSFSHWAYGILRNKIGNAYQAKARNKEDVNSEALDQAGSTRPENTRLRIDILNSFRRLAKENPRYARIINLHQQGYEVEEICRQMRITKANCYALLSRGRQRLKELLEAQGVTI